ncbi:hypothetical protein WIW50_05135 [Flavobacteriaceae bacterium 3-367]
MSYLQPVLAYIILAIAIGYIAKKFFLPKSLFATKKKGGKACGHDDCGCH